MKYLLAVSGGIDSVVLLDYFYHNYPHSDLLVAHFDHNLRSNSHEDYLFVKRLAEKYNLPFFGEKAHLKNSSEETARNARYDFLFKLSKKHHAIIVTAHHLDDLVESVAINLIRGTGWRGLSVLNREGILRPFIDLGWDKARIYKYASFHQLTFREDPTNSDNKYLRNRIRQKLPKNNDVSLAILKLRNRQIEIEQEIVGILSNYIKTSEYPRDIFYNLDPSISDEVLKYILERHNILATRKQRKDCLNAISTFSSGKKFNLPCDKFISFTKNTFKI